EPKARSCLSRRLHTTSTAEVPACSFGDYTSSARGHTPSRGEVVFVVLVLGLVFGGLVVELVRVVELIIRRTSAKLALQRREVGVGGVVLQLPGHLCLLGLSTAAPHGSTPSHRITGQPYQAGPDDVRHLSWLIRYMSRTGFDTSAHRVSRCLCACPHWRTTSNEPHQSYELGAYDPQDRNRASRRPASADHDIGCATSRTATKCSDAEGAPSLGHRSYGPADANV